MSNVFNVFLVIPRCAEAPAIWEFPGTMPIVPQDTRPGIKMPTTRVEKDFAGLKRPMRVGRRGKEHVGFGAGWLNWGMRQGKGTMHSQGSCPMEIRFS